MTPWDDDKSEGDDLTSDEWDNHVVDQKNHSGRHEDGGSDELDVSGLSGVLADAQTPQTEAVQDIVGALLSGGTNITAAYDDANDVLTIDTSALNEEEVEDAVATLITAGNAITVNYDDGADSLSVAVDESSLSFYDGTNITAPVDTTSVSTDDVFSGSVYGILEEFALNDEPAEISVPDLSNNYTITIVLSGYSGTGFGNSFALQVSDNGGSSYYTSDEYDWVLRQHDADTTDRSDEATDSGFVRLASNTSDSGQIRDNPLRINFTSYGCSWQGATVRSTVSQVSGAAKIDDSQVGTVDTVRFVSDDGNDTDIGFAIGYVAVHPRGDISL